jgi:hypothetical protein
MSMHEIMAIFETDEREDDLPASLCHTTFEHHLPSIMKHGLGGAKSQRNFSLTDRGSTEMKLMRTNMAATRMNIMV